VGTRGAAIPQRRSEAVPATYESLQPYRDVLETALTSARIKIKFGTRGKAVHARQNFYRFRKMDRDQSYEAYPPGDPRRGWSPYDALVISLREEGGKWVLEISKSSGMLPGAEEIIKEDLEG
jgi:hypothetical protein